MSDYIGNLLQKVQEAGYTMIVFGGEEEPDYTGTEAKEAYDAITAVDEAELYLRDQTGKKVGWAMIINGLDDEEVIADCGTGDWFDRYMAETSR